MNDATPAQAEFDFVERINSGAQHDPMDPDPEIPTSLPRVMKLTQPQRERRVERLVEMARTRYDESVTQLAGKTIAATCVLISGGNDSYTVAHLFRDVATHAVHANTGTGINATREHVRATMRDWDLPLIEVHPKPGQGYDDLVRGTVTAVSRTTGEVVQAWPGGFPGPAAHQVMYTRLKERGLETVPHHFGVSGHRDRRVLFIAGRRRSESQRRATVPHHDARGTTVWCSPIAVWHKADLRAYRLMVGDVPINPVAQQLGMSGECGCLANAKPGEREHWVTSYPDDPFVLRMLALELEIADRRDIPDRFKRWGNGSLTSEEHPSPAGLLCGVDCGPDPLLDLMDPLFSMVEAHRA